MKHHRTLKIGKKTFFVTAERNRSWSRSWSRSGVGAERGHN